MNQMFPRQYRETVASLIVPVLHIIKHTPTYPGKPLNVPTHTLSHTHTH